MNISEHPRQCINYKTHVIFAKQMSSSDSTDLDFDYTAPNDNDHRKGNEQVNTSLTYLHSFIPDVIKNYYVSDGLNEDENELTSFSIINCKFPENYQKMNGNYKRDQSGHFTR